MRYFIYPPSPPSCEEGGNRFCSLFSLRRKGGRGDRSLRWALLACIALFCRPGAAQEWWQLGGQGGVSPADVADFSLMIDDAAAAHALQPFELDPNENILPQLGPWQRWRFPTDPQFRPGHPRFWTDINHDRLYQATESFLFVDGDLNHIHRAAGLSWHFLHH